MREVGPFEAKNRFATLLDWVEQRKEVVITRRGEAVALLVPNSNGFNRDARAAAEAICEMSKGMSLRD